MYKVRTHNENKLIKNMVDRFNTLEESVQAIKYMIKLEVEYACSNDIIDKYCAEDIMFNIEERIKKDMGFCHEDLYWCNWDIEKI